MELLDTGFREGVVQSPALILPLRSGRELGVARERDAVAFVNAFPGAQLPIAPGSEAFCANVIREFVRANDAEYELLRPDASIDELRQRRCRSIVLLSDYAGSGRQAASASALLTRNASLRSWRSFRWLRIHVLLYAASPTGSRALERQPSIDRLSVMTVADDFGSVGWTQEQRAEIERVCRTYAAGKYKREALGWQQSGGLLVMEHTVPNNLPAVLWQTRGNSRRATTEWFPLFPDRTLPGTLQRYFSQKPSPQQTAKVALHTTPDASAISPVSRQIVLMLQAIRLGVRSREQLASRVAMPLPGVDRLLDQMRTWTLVDDGFRLTDAGRNALRLSYTDEMPSFELIGDDSVYYPQRLRRAREI
ncbi:hypothetical protein EDD27_9101 [Nonomuraea polychroma]|uniref:Uncharacterized protein n=2 Tax=Nonomuraea polychroma TaxID=46176 RepID=A0A438MKL3_9ACTN|nr:hypothetical protein EDD27_9101 [Nonomuraea polychroma]